MKRKRNTMAPKEALMILAASDFEELYFSQVRKDCRYTNLTVLRSKGVQTLEDLIQETAKARRKGKFNVAWALFSFKNLKASPSEIEAAKQLAEQKRVKLGWTNPSLSLWIYLHFKAPAMVIKDANLLTAALGKSIPGYAETEEFILGEGQNLHLSLFTNFSKAIANAAAYNRICVAETGLPGTNIPDIYSDIRRICGNADITHNQKMLTKRT